MKQRSELAGFLQVIDHGSRISRFAKYSDSTIHCSVACILRFKSTVYKELAQRHSIFAKGIEELFVHKHDFENTPKKRMQLWNCIQELMASEQKNLDSVNDVFELLYARRSVCPTDRHSGEICFPGGKLDKGEDELQATQREVMEEIGLDLGNTEQFIYLGKLTDQLFAYYRRQQQVKVSVMLYLAANKDIQMNINPDEVDTAFWIPINSFFSYQPSSLQFKRANVKESVILNALLTDENSTWIAQNDSCRKMVIASEKYVFRYPSVNYPLWGLTMLMTSSLVQVWRNALMSQEADVKSKNFVQKAQYFKILAENEELENKLNKVMAERNKGYLLDL